MSPEEKRTVGELEARLQFKRLIATLSSKLIDLPPGQIGAHINESLAEVAGFLGFNLAAVTKFSGHGSQGKVTHVWTAPGLPAVPAGFTEQDFPWKAQFLANGNDFRAATLDVLPPEAAHDRATYERYGVRSVYEWCLRPGGKVIGCFSLVAIGRPRPFPETFEEGLQLFAQILANALSRERADESLRESAARLSLAADSAEAGLWELDCGTGRFWATERALAIIGLGPNEAVDLERFESMVHPKDLHIVHAAMERALRGGLAIDVEYRIVLHRGRVRWLASRGRPFFSTGGNPERLLGVTIDITKRKETENSLRESFAEIQRLKDRLQAESDFLKAEIKVVQARAEIIGQSPAIKKVLHLAGQVAPTDSSVLIRGETGSGKELVAEAIHRLSPRRAHLMVKVNCAALPSALVESELFGRERGAFTGALTKQVGRFEVADGSTLFLDEIGDLSLDVQAKLLRVLQEGQFERLGSPRTIRVNVRLIAATNRDLAEAVCHGRFREDLYYRLNVFPIHVPPLRERREDIPLMVWSFLEEFSSRMGKKISQVPRKTMEMLQSHSWPGNVRELRNVIENGVIVTAGDALRVPLLEDRALAFPPAQTLADSEREHILRILEQTGWRIKGPSGAATLLGLNPSTLYSRMEKLGIPPRRHRQGALG